MRKFATLLLALVAMFATSVPAYSQQLVGGKATDQSGNSRTQALLVDQDGTLHVVLSGGNFSFNCDIVSGDTSYSAGTSHPPTCTTGGRLRVGLSSVTNIIPGLPDASTTRSDLFGCIYRATPPTWLDGYTGAIQCDANGNITVTLASAGTPGGALPSKAVQVEGSDGTTGRVIRTTADGSIYTVPLQEGFSLISANVSSAATKLFGGDYIFSQVCSAYGTVTLQVLGPDGLSYINVLQKTSSDNGNGTGLTFAGNATVQAAVSGTSGCNATLVRVP